MNNPNLSQTTNTVFMVLPVNFSYNEETAKNNEFQIKDESSDTQKLALQESNAFIKELKDNKVNVISVKDTLNPHTPDSVFPNNWFSTHEDGTLVLYPMFALNRRQERKPEFINAIKENFKTKRIIDLIHYEDKNLFLEGTGSMVIDRINKIIYAAKSPRTSELVLDDLCNKLGYKKIMFDSYSKNNMPIYHTNVMMSIGIDFAIVCLESIKDKQEQNEVVSSLKNTNKTIVEITYEQLEKFAGNMLEIKNTDNERILVMSDTAYKSLNQEQITFLKSKCKIIAPKIPCIEKNGGGSARCMMAEIF